MTGRNVIGRQFKGSECTEAYTWKSCKDQTGMLATVHLCWDNEADVMMRYNDMIGLVLCMYI